jgi:protease I
MTKERQEVGIMERRLDGYRVAIVAADGFEERELAEPRQALDAAGATTRILAPSEHRVKAWDRKVWGNEFPVDTKLDEANPEEFDALLLPGGVMNPDRLREREDAVSFVRSFFDAEKPVASICHGPQVLVDAEVLRGRKLTSYPSIRKDLENAGAEWVDAEVVVDGNLITSRKPEDLPAFIAKTIEVFARSARSVASGRR